MIGSVEFIPLFAILIAIPFGAPSPACAFDHANKASLEAALLRYAADLEAERFDSVAAAVPIGIGTIAMKRTGQIDILDVICDTAQVQIETSSNRYDFAFVPTRTTISEGLGADSIAHSQTFALQENDDWRFLCLEARNDFEAVQTAYPDFANIAPPFQRTQQ